MRPPRRPKKLVSSPADVVEVDASPHELDFEALLEIVLEHDQCPPLLIDGHDEPVRVVLLLELTELVPFVHAKRDEERVVLPALVAVGPEQVGDSIEGRLAVDFQDERSLGLGDRVVAAGGSAAVHDDRVHSRGAR